jgi:hypothetical protein
MALSEQEILRREALTELRKLESTLSANEFITTAIRASLPILKIRKEVILQDD